MRYLCHDLPALQGLIKLCPEDFEVEEIPAYPLAGSGQHLFLWIEKRGRSTQEVADTLARALQARVRDVGYAGQKDRQAVTRQWFSVPSDYLDALPTPEALLEHDAGFKILKTGLHSNKLKTGHLHGNRFRIRVRGAGEAYEAARLRLDRLMSLGVPNYYGSQRFGRDGDNAEKGRALLAGERLKLSRHLRRLYLSALQSELFNTWLDARIDDGLLGEALEGDLLQRRETHGTFLCEDPATDTPRLESGELDPTGPIFGHEMWQAEGPAGAREARILEAAELSLASFLPGAKLTRGARRPARIYPLEPTLERAAGEGTSDSSSADDLWIAFTLPPGAYATVVLDQLLSRAG